MVVRLMNENVGIDNTFEEFKEDEIDQFLSEEDYDALNILDDFPDLKKRNKILMDAILITIFSALAFTLGMIYLSDYITSGTDGGYYELLTGSFIVEGKLYYQSPIIVFLFTSLFTLISGGNLTFGVTFSASLFFAAGVVTNYFAARMTWNRKVATFTLPFSALSVILFRMSTDFMKNLLAMVFIPIALASFSRYHLKREWKYFGLSIGFAALTMGTHLYTALALSVCLVSYYVIYHIITSLEEKRVDWKKLLFSSLLLLAIAAGMGLIWVFNEYAVPVMDTYWGYSSNTLPSASGDGYTTAEESWILPLGAIFNGLPVFETVLLIFGFVFAVGSLAGKASKKERNGIILLFAMLLPIWFLGISVDVDGWLQRMSQDLACFLILASAFSISYFVKGLEKLAEWIENTSPKIKISKMRPKISFTVIVIGLLVVPMIFPNIAVGSTLKPILSPDEVQDLQDMQGQLPVDDCLLYGEHGLEYWATHFTGYECKKLSENYREPEDLYGLVNVSSPVSYLLTRTDNPNIPIVEEGILPYIGDNFILVTPLNGSVHANPMIISCITTPTHTTFRINYRISSYETKQMFSDHDLNSFALPGGNIEWNFTLPTNLPLIPYLLEIEAEYNIAPGQDDVEKIEVIFYPSEPFFNTVYVGEIFAVVEANPSYVPSPMPLPPAPPAPPEDGPGEKSSGFNVLTFIMMIRFPFLTNYLHYYFVIPLTVLYWSLLLFGAYRIPRLIYNQSKKYQENRDEKSD